MDRFAPVDRNDPHWVPRLPRSEPQQLGVRRSIQSYADVLRRVGDGRGRPSADALRSKIRPSRAHPRSPRRPPRARHHQEVARVPVHDRSQTRSPALAPARRHSRCLPVGVWARYVRGECWKRSSSPWGVRYSPGLASLSSVLRSPRWHGRCLPHPHERCVRAARSLRLSTEQPLYVRRSCAHSNVAGGCGASSRGRLRRPAGRFPGRCSRWERSRAHHCLKTSAPKWAAQLKAGLQPVRYRR